MTALRQDRVLWFNGVVVVRIMTEQPPSPATYRPEEVEAMLAMATTGELGADSFNPAIEIARLTSNEIFSAVHVVKDASDRLHRQRMGEPVAVEEIDLRLVKYEADIDAAIDGLPKFAGDEKTRDVFTMLAHSSSPGDRGYAGNYISVLTPVDHDYGIELWRQLLEDDSPSVGKSTWGATSYYFEDGSPEDALRRLAEHGLTWTDLQDLIDTYVRKLQNAGENNNFPDERGA